MLTIIIGVNVFYAALNLIATFIVTIYYSINKDNVYFFGITKINS